MTIDIEHNGTRIVTEADLIALIDERDRLATHAELMQRQRDFQLKQLEKAEQDRIAREGWYRTLLGDHYRLRKERDRLAKENADYREGFDSDGCTAAESCCGEIKGALADKIERLEKELEESRNKQEEYCYDLAAARKELAEVRGGRKVQLGVIEFHSERLNPGLTKRFYSVRDGPMATGAIVDLWLMNIASVLREFGYEMTIVSTSQPSRSTVTNHAVEPEVKP